MKIINQEGEVVLEFKEENPKYNLPFIVTDEDKPNNKRIIVLLAKGHSDIPFFLKKLGKTIWENKIKNEYKIWGENSPPSFFEEWKKIKHIPRNSELQIDVANSQVRLFSETKEFFNQWEKINFEEDRKDFIQKIREDRKKEISNISKKVKKDLDSSKSFEKREEISQNSQEIISQIKNEIRELDSLFG